MPKKRRNVEDSIQSELIRWLRAEYPQWKVFATRNENNSYRVKEIEVGMPDLILRGTGDDNVLNIIWFEVKTSKGRLSEAQVKWREQQEPLHKNEKYGVGYGLADCKKVLTSLLIL